MPTFRFDRKADYNKPFFDMEENFIHPCGVCGEPATFGFGVSLRNGKMGNWYCAMHRPENEM